jgi:hypothetical protein
MGQLRDEGEENSRGVRGEGGGGVGRTAEVSVRAEGVWGS